ncbi:polysaccharide biosynthesis protein [Rubrivirga sp. IMCC43871]|uniref:polysaccharide biosynthesis protein n=1 Tax=Rubrivirga sp. IMCC43871 TaxID=3391575 RepID=UPI00398FDA74
MTGLIANTNVNAWSKYAIDVAVWVAAAPLAFLLRLEGDVAGFVPALVAYAAVGAVLKATAVSAFGLYRRPWRWVGVSDLHGILLKVGSVGALLGVSAALLDGTVVPRSVPIIEAGLAVLMLSAVRLSRRRSHERTRRPDESDTRRALIVGAGDAGVLLVRELLRQPDSGLTPVGFLDDDTSKARQLHLGLPVLGALADLGPVVAEYDIDEVLLALPTAPGAVIRRIVEAARAAGVPSRAVPRLGDIAAGKVRISQMRDVDLEDLLGRDPVRLDAGPIRDYVAGRCVLVTGAGGSIGSEIVRQIAPFGPASVVLLGRGENSIYQINRELAREWPELARHAVVCDVRDRASLAAVFERFSPDVVFHAAAHKHVPLMEDNPAQAVLNNVLGTRNVAQLAAAFGVDRLVNISTDKAVNPTNVMGASKRAAEMVVAEAGADADCAMVSVRFGNVLGSRGSVVPLFREQIGRGGPLTVTHPEMVRYFMTIPEAAQLVLQAGASAENGRVYVLDMGEPVRIADLARDLVLLSGLEPGVDIEIKFSGTRPGEKLYEELLMAEEGTEPGPHEKILMARGLMAPGDLGPLIDDLEAQAISGDGEAIRAAFARLVPTYRPENAAVVGSGRVHGDGASTPAPTMHWIARPKREHVTA